VLRRERGQVSVFFIDDNFAINIKRTKSLLRRHHRSRRATTLTAQIALTYCAMKNWWTDRGIRRQVDLYRMESIDPANLADVNKSFNKPNEYAAVLQRLAQPQYICDHVLSYLALDTTRLVLLSELAANRNMAAGHARFGPLTPLPEHRCMPGWVQKGD